jgi:hypothetical protein
MDQAAVGVERRGGVASQTRRPVTLPISSVFAPIAPPPTAVQS